MNIQQLNKQFAIPNQVVFISGQGQQPYIQVQNSKANALISLYGGQVLSYRPIAASEDLLFLSNKARFQPGKAIRGGVPICWPWFANDPKQAAGPAHGFARLHYWSVSAVTPLEDGGTEIELKLNDSSQTLRIWPYPFSLRLNVIIADSLNIKLSMKNYGNQAFSTTMALHSYFQVGNATNVQIIGLEDNEYQDKTRNFMMQRQTGAMTFSDETDRIYQPTKTRQTLIDPDLKRKIEINSYHHQNIVIWNPWSKGATTISDLENNAFKRFVCVETAIIKPAQIIAPHTDYSIGANYRILV